VSRSPRRGGSTSGVELTNVSAHGCWLLADGQEYFLAFTDFPWFRDATIGQLSRIERPAPGHLRWPELDVDLALESIRHPASYPLVSRLPATVRERPATPGHSRRPAPKK
jgi:hypothetical protein